MSGLIGHTMYGVLAWKEAKARGLAVAPLIEGHLPSFLCGAYLGCDIQIMPEALCIDTGKEVGLGTVPLEKSPITGGPVHPWTLEHAGVRYGAANSGEFSAMDGSRNHSRYSRRC